MERFLCLEVGAPPDEIDICERPDGVSRRESIETHHLCAAACSGCHSQMDPLGFALESFDPIGGYRNRYRSTGKGEKTKRQFRGRPIREYREGPAVDASGVTEAGETFKGIREYKKILANQNSMVTSNLLTQLVVYSTGAEVQFADRDQIAEMTQNNLKSLGGVRDLIHALIQSELFLNK